MPAEDTPQTGARQGGPGGRRGQVGAGGSQGAPDPGQGAAWTVRNPPFPAGFNAKDQPWGVGFTSTACNEPRLFEIAFAFEQASKRRKAPTLP